MSAEKANAAKASGDKVIGAKHRGTHQIVERKNDVKETGGPENK